MISSGGNKGRIALNIELIDSASKGLLEVTNQIHALLGEFKQLTAVLQGISSVQASQTAATERQTKAEKEQIDVVKALAKANEQAIKDTSRLDAERLREKEQQAKHEEKLGLDMLQTRTKMENLFRDQRFQADKDDETRRTSLIKQEEGRRDQLVKEALERRTARRKAATEQEKREIQAMMSVVGQRQGVGTFFLAGKSAAEADAEHRAQQLQKEAEARRAAAAATKLQIDELRKKTSYMRGDTAASNEYDKALRLQRIASLEAATGNHQLAVSLVRLEREYETLQRKEAKRRKLLLDLKTASYSIGFTLVGMGTAIIGADIAGIKFAADMQEAMVRVAKTTGMSDEAIAALTKRFVNLSTMMPKTTTELAQIAAIAGQMGLSGEKDVGGFTESIAKLSRVMDMGVEDMATSMSILKNIFKIPTEDIMRLGSVINTLENTTEATAAQIIDLMQRMGGAAVTIGLSSDQVAAMGATLIKLGIDAEIGGTAMNRVFTAMLVKSREFASQAKMSTSEWVNLINNDAMGAFRAWLGEFGKLDKFQRVAALGQLGLANAQRGALTVLLKLADSQKFLNDNLQTAGQEAIDGTSAQREYEKSIQNLNDQVRILWNTIKAFALEAGNQFLPMLEKWVARAKSFTDWFRQTNDAAKALILALGMGVGGTLGLAGVTFFFLPRILDFAEALSLLKKRATAAAFAQRLLNIAIKANPYVIAFTAIMTVAGAFGLLSSNEDAAEDSMASIGKAAEGLSNKLKPLGQEVCAIVEMHSLQQRLAFFGRKAKAGMPALPAEQQEIESIQSRIAQLNDTIKGHTETVKQNTGEIDLSTEAEKSKTEQTKLQIAKLQLEKAELLNNADAIAKARNEVERLTAAQAAESTGNAVLGKQLGVLTVEVERLREAKKKVAQASQELENHEKALSASKKRLTDIVQGEGNREEGVARRIKKAYEDRLQAANEWYAERQRVNKSLLEEGGAIDVYNKRMVESRSHRDAELKAANDARLTDEADALRNHMESIDALLEEAAYNQLALDSNTIQQIIDNDKRTYEEKEKDLKQYIERVKKETDAIRSIEDEIASFSVKKEKDTFVARVKEAENWLKERNAQIARNVKNEQEAERLKADARKTSEEVIAKINKDRMKKEGTVSEKLQLAWKEWEEKTIESTRGVFGFFEDAIDAAAKFFQEAFVAVITLDLKRLANAFIGFFQSILKAFEELIAQEIAKGLYKILIPALKALLKWLGIIKEEIQQTNEEWKKIPDANKNLIEMTGTVWGLTAAWAGLNMQMMVMDKILSKVKGLDEQLTFNLKPALFDIGRIFKTIGGGKDVFGMISKISWSALGKAGVTIAAAFAAFKGGQALGKLFGFGPRGQNAMGGALGGGLGVGLAASFLGLGPLGVGLAALFGAAGGGFLGSAFGGGKPPRVGVRLGTNFEGLIESQMGKIQMGIVDVYVKSLKKISMGEGQGIAAKVESALRGGLTSWARLFNKFPDDVLGAILPSIHAANENLKNIFDRITLITREDFGALVSGYIKSIPKKLRREFTPALEEGLRKWITNLTDSFTKYFVDRSRDITEGSTVSIVNKIRDDLLKAFIGDEKNKGFTDRFAKSSAKNQVKWLQATESLMGILDIFSESQGLFTGGETGEAANILKQLTALIDATTGASAKELEDIIAAFDDFAKNLGQTITFLKEQQDIVDKGTLTNFAYQLKKLQQQFHDTRKTAEALGVGMHEVNGEMQGIVIDAEKIQLQVLIDQFFKPLADLSTEIQTSVNNLLGNGISLADQFAHFIAVIQDADPEKSLAAASSAFDVAQKWYAQFGEFSEMAERAGGEIIQLQGEVLRELPDIGHDFLAMVDQIGDTTTEMTLEVRLGLMKNMESSLKDAQKTLDKIKERRESLEAKISDLRDNTLGAYTDLLKSLDESLGEGMTDFMGAFESAMDKMADLDAQGKLDAGREAMDAIGNWFTGLGDFSSIAKEAQDKLGENISSGATLAKLLGMELKREPINAVAGEGSTEVMGYNLADALAAVGEMISKIGDLSLEERGGALQKASEALTLIGEIQDEQKSLMEKAIKRFYDGQRDIAEAATNSDDLQRLIAADEVSAMQALEASMAGLGGLWQQIADAATKSDEDARAIYKEKMESIRMAIETEKTVLEASLMGMQADLEGLKEQEEAGSTFLLEGWKQLQDIALQSQEQAKSEMLEKLEIIRQAIADEMDLLGGMVSSMNVNLDQFTQIVQDALDTVIPDVTDISDVISNDLPKVIDDLDKAATDLPAIQDVIKGTAGWQAAVESILTDKLIQAVQMSDFLVVDAIDRNAQWLEDDQDEQVHYLADLLSTINESIGGNIGWVVGALDQNIGYLVGALDQNIQYLVQSNLNTAQWMVDGQNDQVNFLGDVLIDIKETINSTSIRMRDGATLRDIYDAIQTSSPGGFAAQHGLDYVPTDNYPILAHKGEAVITAQGNEGIGKILSEIKKNGNQNITVVIQPAPIILDGKQIAEVTFKQIQNQPGRKIIPSGAIYNS